MIGSDSLQQGIEERWGAKKEDHGAAQGKGSFTAVNHLARTYDNNVTRDGKPRFIDARVDHRDERGRTQTNLHLTSQRKQDTDGEIRYNNGATYSASQFEKIATAGGRADHGPGRQGDRDGSASSIATATRRRGWAWYSTPRRRPVRLQG